MNSSFVEDQLTLARVALSGAMPMSDAQWEVFKGALNIRYFEKNQVILHAGERERYLSMMLSGLTRHYVVNESGEDVSFDFSFQHEFNCSFASFITQEPSRFSIEALQDTVLASMPYDFLQGLYEAHPESNLIGRVAVEQYYLWREEREVSLLMDPAEERYLRLINKQPHYLQEVPLKYIASYLNVKPESLSRIRKRIAERRTIS